MPLIPRLPSGYHAQPAFHHQTDGVSFDFYRAYTPERAHDELRSFWLMTDNPETRGPMSPRTPTHNDARASLRSPSVASLPTGPVITNSTN